MPDRDQTGLRLVPDGTSDGAALSEQHPRRVRVLLVDDDPLVLTAYRRSLRRFFDVEIATGGAAALERFEADRDFDVVLCDIVMPGVGGPEVAQTVKRRWPELDRRLLFWTAGVTGAKLERFVEVERRRVFQKGDLEPRDVIELLAGAAERP